MKNELIWLLEIFETICGKKILRQQVQWPSNELDSTVKGDAWQKSLTDDDENLL